MRGRVSVHTHFCIGANNRINTAIRRRWRRGILNYLLYVEAISSVLGLQSRDKAAI